MTTRVTTSDREQAIALADLLRDRGFDVALITEREGDEESPASYLVATPATLAELGGLIPSAFEARED